MSRAVVVIVLGGAALGCTSDPTLPRREIMPEMVESVPYDSYAPNPNTKDGKTLQAPPKGAIPRGHHPFHYGPGPIEAERAGRELLNPLQPTKETLARGEKMFQTFCTPCHGKTGLGDGPVIPKFPTPPSLVAPHAVAMPDGRLYHVITTGQGVMPPHGAQVAPIDRWKLIHFLRQMQGVGAKGGAS